MPSYRTATVTELLGQRRGLQRVATTEGRAYVLTDLTGPVAVADDVVLSTTAVELGLGTGGWHVVHWNLARREWVEPGPGHIMKLRYTSLQRDAGAAEETATMSEDLAGTPVVACTVHSQVACVVAAVCHTRPDASVAYVMTDGAALPLALSDLVAALTEKGLLVGTVTAGHAFGGDLEAVSVPSAMTLAKGTWAADVIVVGMGPGVVGTGTRLGTTAVEAAAIADAAAALGADPIVAVRASSGDERPRHRGGSHHTETVLELVRSPVTVGLPRTGIDLPGGRFGVERVDVPDMPRVLEAFGLRVTSMGRGPDEDPLFFACAGAAGVVAATHIPRS
ncbi:MAG: DUF3866 family protein [Acidimicrobiales bacterium]